MYAGKYTFGEIVSSSTHSVTLGDMKAQRLDNGPLSITS